MTPEQLVQAQLLAYNSRDIDAFVACYHPEVVVKELLSDRLLCQGIEPFREMYRQLFEKCPQLRCEIKTRMILENTIIDEEFVTGMEKYPQGLHIAAVYGFKDGLIYQVFFAR